MNLKRTPLFAAHLRAGARLIDFGGWEMPVQYSSIVDEHLCVRRATGIFDISHMGEVLVSGPSAAEFLNQTLTNDIRKLAIGQGQYTLMCNEHGGVIDDLYAYRMADKGYLLVINASRIEADVRWLELRLASSRLARKVDLVNDSDRSGAIAIQGPRSAEIITATFSRRFISAVNGLTVSSLKKNQIGVWRTTKMEMFEFEMWVSRTGYTGEDGFEIIAPASRIECVWEWMLEAGHAYCLQPCGLGARDTLRTEMCYPLYGHELDENTTPIEAGLGFFVALDKGDFVGREVLATQKANGTRKKLVAFKMTEKSAPPRPHYAIVVNGTKVGEVVSGTQSPTLNCGIGMGYVPPELAMIGAEVGIEIRGKVAPAMVGAKPFYKKDKLTKI